MSTIKTLNASLLIVGTSIGAGMLALPVETGEGGFVPSLVILVLNWLIMTTTALLFVALLDKHKKGANFITLSEKILGKFFKVLTFVVYIGLFLSLTLAYVKGGGVFIADTLSDTPVAIGCLIFLLIFTPLIILGSRILSYGNSVLTFALVASFILLVFLGIKHIHPSFLTHRAWKAGWLSYPIFVTAFGFHGVLPSLHSYVANKKSLMISVVIGTSITFVVYLIWQLIVMGLVPLDDLLQTLAADQTAITPLKTYIQSPLFTLFAQVFYFTALTTSFLGVGLGLIDFLLDSLKLKQKGMNRFLLCVLIYLPALWIGQSSLRVFYLSLKYGGGLACFYLLVFLPTLLFIQNKKRAT